MKTWLDLFSTIVPIAILSGCASHTLDPQAGHWIDLTHDFSSTTIYWPNAETFKLEKVFDGDTHGGYHYSANRYSAAEHGGTHMDAPIHFNQQGETVEQIGLDRTIGPAVVIDVSSETAKNRDYLVGAIDFIKFETTHGNIKPGSIILIYTGYDRYWPDALRYLGTDARGDEAVPKLHFPGLSPEGANWLIEKRNIRAVGLDTASIDYGQSRDFRAHRIMALHSVPVFENLSALDKLPPIGAVFMGFPMKIQAGSGAPLRAAAYIEE